MKEKKEPSYDLSTVQAAFQTIDALVMTYSAMRGQYELGFSDQDVYKSIFQGEFLYIKFQRAKNGQMIISFKAR